MTQGQRKLFSSDGGEPTVVVPGGTISTGLNYVVMVGALAAKENNLKVGKQADVVDNNGDGAGRCLITHKIICRLSDIPKEVFSRYHDPVLRNPICLMDFLQNESDRRFDSDEMMTCIGFKVL